MTNKNGPITGHWVTPQDAVGEDDTQTELNTVCPVNQKFLIEDISCEWTPYALQFVA